MFVKICGLTTEEDALAAVALGADALGFVFAPSTRQVSVSKVRDITRRLPPDTLTVGVFRDELPEVVVDTVRSAGLVGAQLHGAEPVRHVRAVKAELPFVIDAFPAGSPAIQTAENSPADVVLIDAATPGSGRVFDWSLLEHAPRGMRVLLAGGLTHENVASAIERVRPWGVDVSTGVESAPGCKDPRKMTRFLQEARSAAQQLSEDGPAPFDWRND